MQLYLLLALFKKRKNTFLSIVSFILKVEYVIIGHPESILLQGSISAANFILLIAP